MTASRTHRLGRITGVSRPQRCRKASPRTLARRFRGRRRARCPGCARPVRDESRTRASVTRPNTRPIRTRRSRPVRTSAHRTRSSWPLKLRFARLPVEQPGQRDRLGAKNGTGQERADGGSQPVDQLLRRQSWRPRDQTWPARRRSARNVCLDGHFASETSHLSLDHSDDASNRSGTDTKVLADRVRIRPSAAGERRIDDGHGRFSTRYINRKERPAASRTCHASK